MFQHGGERLVSEHRRRVPAGRGGALQETRLSVEEHLLEAERFGEVHAVQIRRVVVTVLDGLVERRTWGKGDEDISIDNNDAMPFRHSLEGL